MLVTKQQLEARRLASKDLERFNLTHIKITPAAGSGADVVATNGHLAVRVRSRDLPDETAVPAVPRQGGADPDRAVYLHAAAAADAAKILPKNSELPSFQLGRLTVEERAAGANLSVGGSDTLTHHLVQTQEPADLPYPNVERLLTEQAAKTPVAQVLLSAEHIALIAAYAKQFAASGAPAVKLLYYGPDQAVGIEWEDPRHTVQALLMPMKDTSARQAYAAGAEVEVVIAPEIAERVVETLAGLASVPPLTVADPAAAVAGVTPLVPDTIAGVDDALARAALNAREKAAKARGARPTNSDEPLPSP